MPDRPLACVIGDMDIVRPLGMEGIRCVAAGPRGAPPRWSRYTEDAIDLLDLWDEPEQMVDRLVAFARTQPVPPVLIYQKDPAVLAISRFRDVLEPWMRFIVPPAGLVEDLIDKQRFHRRAVELGLPVPKTVFGHAGSEAAPVDEAPFPAVVKPVLRRRPQQTWKPVARGAKALLVDDAEQLRSVWTRPELRGTLLVVQEFIPGDETNVVSYHTFVDADRVTIGEFTGRKIRTRPAAFGQSTAVEITRDEAVRAMGREILEAFDFFGVAKVDFKRTPDGSFRLLEINPRNSLWHHPGAMAGVNLPAAMYRSLIGEKVAPLPPAKPGMTWCQLWGDSLAARANGVSMGEWLRFARAADSRRAMHADDLRAALGVGSYGAQLAIRNVVRTARNEFARRAGR